MKVWNSRDKEDKLKDVAIALHDKSLVAVDAETGEIVAYLYNFGIMLTIELAKRALDRNGYRTDFAEWDDNGRMTKLLEPFD